MFPAGASPLRSVVHKFEGPVLDQGDEGSCTGHAVAQALNMTMQAKNSMARDLRKKVKVVDFPDNLLNYFGCEHALPRLYQRR